MSEADSTLEKRPGRPKGAKQNHPTKAEITAAWVRLREAENAGDIQASALLIALTNAQAV